jgi:hypothetical protein
MIHLSKRLMFRGAAAGFPVEKMIANDCQLLLYEKVFSKACLLCGVLSVSCLVYDLCRLSGECLAWD